MTLEQTLAALGATATVITFLVGGVDWLIRKWLQKHRDETITALNEKVHDLHDDVADLTRERDQARIEILVFPKPPPAISYVDLDLAGRSVGLSGTIRVRVPSEKWREPEPEQRPEPKRPGSKAKR